MISRQRKLLDSKPGNQEVKGRGGGGVGGGGVRMHFKSFFELVDMIPDSYY